MPQPEPATVRDELAAMRRLAALLDALDEPTRRRVFGWLVARYAPADTEPDVIREDAR